MRLRATIPLAFVFAISVAPEMSTRASSGAVTAPSFRLPLLFEGLTPTP